MLTFSKLPNPYRGTIPFSQWQTEGGTGAQVHATCQVAALETEDAIKAWQGEEPFYDYVPFQRQAAGFEDDPADWIARRAGPHGRRPRDGAPTPRRPARRTLGGVYTPADEIQTTTAALNAGYLEHETAPLTAEIARLEASARDAAGAFAALQGVLDAARAEIARLTAAASPLRVALPTAALAAGTLARRGTTATVTGPAGARVGRDADRHGAARPQARARLAAARARRRDDRRRRERRGAARAQAVRPPRAAPARAHRRRHGHRAGPATASPPPATTVTRARRRAARSPPARARAHTEVKSTSPSAGASAKRPLRTVTVTFTQPIQRGTLRVKGPGKVVVSDGAAAAATRATSPGSRCACRSGLGAGRYKATWTIKAVDGHRQSGSFRFRLA